MKYMSLGDWADAAISLLLLVTFAVATTTYFDLLAPLGKTGTKIFLMSAAAIFSYQAGYYFYARAVSSVRSKRIQAEIDLDRALRKLSGEEHY